MVIAGVLDTSDLFFEEVIASSVDDPDFVSRQWLNDQIVSALDEPSCRYLLLTGEPGAGKTVVAASLARQHPNWLRYFIRRNSWAVLSGGDIRSFLFSLGHQLAARRPMLFQPAKLEIVVNQRVGVIRDTGQVVGIQIDDLQVSPFFQTALRVTQDVDEISGLLTGIAVKEAHVEPRLLESDNLQYLALFDPAKVLLAEEPNSRIVVLLDGLDELSWDSSLLDWLVSSPELPENVRFVLTSRPHPSLHLLMSRRVQSLMHQRIEPTHPKIRKDLTTYASQIVKEAPISEMLATESVIAEAFVRQTVDKSDGNFAYLVAYYRALREAVRRQDTDACLQLLRLTDVPSGLNDLYGFFLNLLRINIEQIGMLEIRVPLSAVDHAVPAWEGVGQAVLGVLAVAREALTIEQIARFGNIRVWTRDLTNVLERLTQFLDQEAGEYRLFHSSFAEFLTASITLAQQSHWTVDPTEWHERILRSYRREAPSWTEVEWSSVDRYGLLHIVEHLKALGGTAADEVVELVNPGARRAMLSMFKTDSQFHRIVDQAIEQTMTELDLSMSLPRLLGLTTVRTRIQGEGHQMTPAVLGLLARLGGIDHALEYLGIMAPSMQRFQGLRQVRLHAPPNDLSRVGTLADIERLVQYALDIRPGIAYMPERRNALRIAAIELASVNLTRALQLADLSDDKSNMEAHDAVLQAAVVAADSVEATELIPQMGSNRALAYIDAAQRATNMEGSENGRKRLLELAAAEIEREESQVTPTVLAKLAVTWAQLDSTRALNSLDGLRTMVNQFVSKAVDSKDVANASAESQLAVDLGEFVDAASILFSFQLGEAKALLERVCQLPVNTFSSRPLMDAAELWARWGEYSKCRQLVDSLLTFERSLGWFGPAREITRLATILAPFDGPKAMSLVDEAFRMIEPVLDPGDSIRQLQLDSTLSEMVTSLLTWDTERALRVANWIKNTYWIRGSPGVNADNQADAIALIGLSLADTQPARAQELLDECLNIATTRIDENSDEQQVTSSRGYFHIVREQHPDEDGRALRDATTKQSQVLLAITYFMNVLNYYRAERQSRLATTPADTVRWVLPSPNFVGSPYRWARTFRCFAEYAATSDLGLAETMLEAITDPTERAVGFGSFFNMLAAQGDDRAVLFKELALKALEAVPHYECDINLMSLENPIPVANFLNPEVWARFEVALHLAPFEPNSAFALIEELDVAYLVGTVRADTLFRVIMMTAKAEETGGQESINGIATFHKQLLDSANRWSDPVHASLILGSLAFAIAHYNPAAVEGILNQISMPVYRALAEIILASLLETHDKHRVVERCQQAVKELPLDVPPHQVAAVVAKAAVSLVEIDPEAAELLVREGLNAARQVGYLFYRGLAIIEYMSLKVKGVETAVLVAEVESLIEKLGNHYHAAELLCRLFPILVDMFPERALSAISRIQDWGWPYTMALLEHAAPTMVKHYGIRIASAMHRALVDAFACLIDPLNPSATSSAVDGVNLHVGG